jgi:hypothetical protein
MEVIEKREAWNKGKLRQLEATSQAKTIWAMYKMADQF